MKSLITWVPRDVWVFLALLMVLFSTARAFRWIIG